MHKTFNIKAIYTGLLLALFMSPQLMGTLHHAFMHHDEPHAHRSSKLVFSANEKECAWCDFQFMQFLQEDFVYRYQETVTHIYRQKYDLIVENVASADNISRKGRAPPHILTSA